MGFYVCVPCVSFRSAKRGGSTFLGGSDSVDGQMAGEGVECMNNEDVRVSSCCLS